MNWSRRGQLINDCVTFYDLNDCDTVSAVIMQRISEHKFITSIYNESCTVGETAELGYEQSRGVKSDQDGNGG